MFSSHWNGFIVAYLITFILKACISTVRMWLYCVFLRDVKMDCDGGYMILFGDSFVESTLSFFVV